MEKALRCRKRRSIFQRRNRKTKYSKKYVKKAEIDQIIQVFGKENNQTIVIKKVSAAARVFEILLTAGYYFLRCLLWGGICIALTILLNILMNHHLRQMIVQHYQEILKMQIGL